MEREKKWTRLCSLKSLRPALVDLWFRAEKGSLRAGLTRDLFVSSRGHLTGTARFFVAQIHEGGGSVVRQSREWAGPSLECATRGYFFAFVFISDARRLGYLLHSFVALHAQLET